MAEEQNKPTLTELSVTAHADLKVDTTGALKIAANQHIINLKMSEVSMAISSFPVFLSRVSDESNWNISAINSYELGDNLFVENEMWTGTHVPIGMQTYPFFLMRSPKDESTFTIGIDEKASVFSKDEGEALFEEGKASARLSQATAQLELEIKHEIQTHQFSKKVEELGLIRPVDLQVHYLNGRVNTLKGLNTINEVALHELDGEKLIELRKEGFLMPLYAMLTSVYQFNNLIKLHNAKFPDNKIGQVKLDTPKEEGEEAQA